LLLGGREVLSDSAGWTVRLVSERWLGGVRVKIRFGLGLGADTAPDMLSTVVDQLEAAGVDSLWFSELVSTKAVDPFVGMAYALARTTQVRPNHRGLKAATEEWPLTLGRLVWKRASSPTVAAAREPR
jgi:hypothetical protein